MSEMVDRVAHAIAVVQGDKSVFDYHIAQARVAISQMREPTDMMVQRGAEANDKYATEIAPCSGFRSIDSWRAMIDEALK